MLAHRFNFCNQVVDLLHQMRFQCFRGSKRFDEECDEIGGRESSSIVGHFEVQST